MEAISVIFETGGRPVDAADLERMQRAVVHRGAACSSFVDRDLALGKRSTSDEPGSAGVERSGEIVIAFGGALFNRDELVAMDGFDHSGPPVMSDGLAVIGAYRAWGERCCERLDGDFAFALFDRARAELLCACDPIGVKPAFYAFDGRRFVAGSEPKQLLAAGVSGTPCEEKIASYLSVAPHLCGGPATFYSGISRLRPGHALTVGRSGVRLRRFWALDGARRLDERSQDDVAARVRELMTRAVRVRAPRRGPYGCALSGGFDSSSIAALYRRELDARGVDAPLETFAFLLRDESADESDIVESVARTVGARRHDVYVDTSGVLDVMPRMIAALDGPVIDLGVMLLWRKKERVAQAGVSCVLSGLGGDELFMGRLHYFADLLRTLRLASLYREVRACYPVDPSTSKRTSLRALLSNYAVLPLFPRPLKKAARAALLGERPIGPWINPDFARRHLLADKVRASPPRVFRDCYRQDCWETFEYALVGETLPVHEALGAAFGVDTRFPLLDKSLVEYMFAVPREMKVREGRSRIVQRAAMNGILPDIVLDEHIKKDFHPALVRQQRESFEHALVDVLSRPRLLSSPYVNWDHIRAEYPRYLAGGAKRWFPLLYALSLESWLGALERGTEPPASG